MRSRVVLALLALTLVALVSSTGASIYDIPNESKYEWELLEKTVPGKYFGFLNDYLIKKERNEAATSSGAEKPEGRETYEWTLPGVKDKSYMCVIPYETPDVTEEEIKAAESTLPVEDFLRPATAEDCIYRWEGWWSYELCFDKYIRQFHQEKDGTTTAEFFLGRLSDPLDSVSTDQYHVVTYNKGTTCDLTKDERSTRVLYRCNPTAETLVFGELKEPATCKYDIVVESPTLCKHPKYARKGSEVASKIQCFETPLPSREDVQSAVATLGLNNKIPSTAGPKKGDRVTAGPDTASTKKMDYMGLLHQKLQKVALTPKFLGVDLLEYIYSLYGATPKFDWVTREKVMDLRFDFRWSKLNERLDELEFDEDLFDDEVDELMKRLPEGRNTFEWLSMDILKEVMDKLTLAHEDAMFAAISLKTSSILKNLGFPEKQLTEDDVNLFWDMIELKQFDVELLESNADYIALVKTYATMTEAEIELRISRLEAQLLELEAEYETLDEITLRLIAYVGSFDLQLLDDLGQTRIVHVVVDGSDKGENKKKPDAQDEF